jgi:hypothetical protein
MSLATYDTPTAGTVTTTTVTTTTSTGRLGVGKVDLDINIVSNGCTHSNSSSVKVLVVHGVDGGISLLLGAVGLL